MVAFWHVVRRLEEPFPIAQNVATCHLILILVIATARPARSGLRSKDKKNKSTAFLHLTVLLTISTTSPALSQPTYFHEQ
jgi:hypothetical protein